MKDKPKCYRYKDATLYKLKDNRVQVERLGEGIGILLKCLSKEGKATPHVITDIKGNVRTTSFVLSIESASALYFALQTLITLDDVTDFITIPDSPIPL